MMAQISAMNDRIELGLTPQTPQTPQPPTVTMQERTLMETPKVQRPHDIAYHDLMASSSNQQALPDATANTHHGKNTTLSRRVHGKTSHVYEIISDSFQKG